MPIDPLDNIEVNDTLNEGRVKLNNNFTEISSYVDTLATQADSDSKFGPENKPRLSTLDPVSYDFNLGGTVGASAASSKEYRFEVTGEVAFNTISLRNYLDATGSITIKKTTASWQDLETLLTLSDPSVLGQETLGGDIHNIFDLGTTVSFSSGEYFIVVLGGNLGAYTDNTSSFPYVSGNLSFVGSYVNPNLNVLSTSIKFSLSQALPKGVIGNVDLSDIDGYDSAAEGEVPTKSATGLEWTDLSSGVDTSNLYGPSNKPYLAQSVGAQIDQEPDPLLGTYGQRNSDGLQFRVTPTEAVFLAGIKVPANASSGDGTLSLVVWREDTETLVAQGSNVNVQTGVAFEASLGTPIELEVGVNYLIGIYFSVRTSGFSGFREDEPSYDGFTLFSGYAQGDATTFPTWNSANSYWPPYTFVLSDTIPKGVVGPLDLSDLDGYDAATESQVPSKSATGLTWTDFPAPEVTQAELDVVISDVNEKFGPTNKPLLKDVEPVEVHIWEGLGQDQFKSADDWLLIRADETFVFDTVRIFGNNGVPTLTITERDSANNLLSTYAVVADPVNEVYETRNFWRFDLSSAITIPAGSYFRIDATYGGAFHYKNYHGNLEVSPVTVGPFTLVDSSMTINVYYSPETVFTLLGTAPQKSVIGPLDLSDLDGYDAATEGQVVTKGATGLTWTSFPPQSFVIAASDETTDLTTGTAKATFRMPYAFELEDVRASVTTAPVGADIQVDVNENGVSILSTVISIDSGEKTSTTAVTLPVVSDTTLADDAEITIDIDQVGSTTAGTGLKVTLIGRPT